MKAKSPIIKTIANAIRDGMDQGLTLDQSLARINIRKSVYNKYCKEKQIVKALIDGESLHKSYWQGTFYDVIHNRRNIVDQSARQLLIEFYKTINNIDVKTKGNDQTIPKINIFNIGDKKNRRK